MERVSSYPLPALLSLLICTAVSGQEDVFQLRWTGATQMSVIPEYPVGEEFAVEFAVDRNLPFDPATLSATDSTEMFCVGPPPFVDDWVDDYTFMLQPGDGVSEVDRIIITATYDGIGLDSIPPSLEIETRFITTLTFDPGTILGAEMPSLARLATRSRDGEICIVDWIGDELLYKTYLEVSTDLAGDFDDDNDFDCDDINELVAAIANGTGDATFDLNGDSMVDSSDVEAWLAIAGDAMSRTGNPILLGDANLDGVVDVTDLNRWSGNKFTTAAGWCGGDFNADGLVDVSDLNVWNANKFQVADSAVAVPEPRRLTLIGVMAVLLGTQRIRRRAEVVEA